MKNISIDELELAERIEKNYNRLNEPYYRIDNVFSPKEYDWQGDKEGRALLAFTCHYSIHQRKIPCMDKMIELIPQKTNEFFYFGSTDKSIIEEQQLSGHNWYLRGLLHYYQLFGDNRALVYANSVVDNLYLPIKEKIHNYPTEFIIKEGGVSGNSCVEKNGWLLSTDTACILMCIDGLAHYYDAFRNNEVLELLDELYKLFIRIDKMAIKAQTHCCLTAARGLIKLYEATKNEKYIIASIDLFDLYLNYGMTLTYQNFNWWGRGETWTEPCAIIDSLIVSLELFKITNNKKYQKIAARIWHNGFAAMQVGNGGAGTTTTVNENQHYLYTLKYEAEFCCTMRLAEGLLYVTKNKELIIAIYEELKKDETGRYMAGDFIYCQVIAPKEIEEQITLNKIKRKDNYNLMPIVKYYNLPKEITDVIKMKIIFV